jgi:hypothetical protein
MTKEQTYVLGFNIALDRVKEEACNFQMNVADVDILVVLDIIDDLRSMVNGTNENVDVF